VTGDVVEQGRAARPVRVAAGVVVLLAIVAVRVTAARHDATPAASRSPSPSVSLVPLETIAPEEEPVGGLEVPPGFVVAPAGDAADAMTLTVLGDRTAVRVRTADDSTTTLYDLPDDQVADYVPTRDGWVMVSEPWARFHTARGETRVPIDGLTIAVPGDGDVWLAYLGDGTIRHYSTDGRPLGPAVRLPAGEDTLRRFLADGRLLLTPSDAAVIETWRPGGRVRTMLTSAVLLASSPTHLAWWDAACAQTNKRPCAVHVLDLAKGTEWSSPLSRGAFPELGVISDDGTAIAYLVGGGDDPRVLVARRDDPRPRLVAAAPIDGMPGAHFFEIDFAADGRLLVVESDLDTTWVAYAWDGRLVRLGVYDLAPLRGVLAD
jgi:hypothetical protein